MKLVIVGSTGLVATEIIRQALALPNITSIVGLARRETGLTKGLPPNADASKLKTLVVDNFEDYSVDAKQQLKGADACIWLDCLFPFLNTLQSMTSEESKHICFDYLKYGLQAIAPEANSPFRFIYISGAKSERDQSKRPLVLREFCLMRGECENHVLDYAKQSNGQVTGIIARPGIVDAPGRTDFMLSFFGTIARSIIGLPKCHVTEFAATLLASCINGSDKETLLNEDLVSIGQSFLQKNYPGEVR